VRRVRSGCVREHPFVDCSANVPRNPIALCEQERVVDPRYYHSTAVRVDHGGEHAVRLPIRLGRNDRLYGSSAPSFATLRARMADRRNLWTVASQITSPESSPVKSCALSAALGLPDDETT
jgi:hypothetical protein